MIKYTKISREEYYNISSKEERERNSYCIKYYNGDKHWLVNNKFHREDGPAIEYTDGDKFWYINDILYTFEEWLEKLDITDEEKILLKLKYS